MSMSFATVPPVTTQKQDGILTYFRLTLHIHSHLFSYLLIRGQSGAIKADYINCCLIHMNRLQLDLKFSPSAFLMNHILLEQSFIDQNTLVSICYRKIEHRYAHHTGINKRQCLKRIHLKIHLGHFCSATQQKSDSLAYSNQIGLVICSWTNRLRHEINLQTQSNYKHILIKCGFWKCENSRSLWLSPGVDMVCILHREQSKPSSAALSTSSSEFSPWHEAWTHLQTKRH